MLITDIFADNNAVFLFEKAVGWLAEHASGFAADFLVYSSKTGDFLSAQFLGNRDRPAQ
jgi:hypothetical protein